MTLIPHNFLASVKSRSAQNQIRRLTTSDGHIAQSKSEVIEEISSFYQSQLGSAANMLPIIQEDIMLEGHRLNRVQQLQLIAQVSKEEVYNAMRDIDDQKAPGCDGFNSHFFQENLGHCR